tara:strand:+ start:242 stop:889 length:648 start_codon:yes stop_codon:yes gene_type:complete
MNTKLINIESINKRIDNEYDPSITNELSDENLMSHYKKCPSVEKKYKEFETILTKHQVDDNKTSTIIDDLIPLNIAPGLKGQVRGKRFNDIIQNNIENITFLKDPRYNVEFEKNCPDYDTSEIPDWYIQDNTTNKKMIGMNQLDLWGGGAQSNRGSKYIINNPSSEKSKFICVIANYIHITSDKNKAYKFLKIGFEKNILCYIKNLEKIIKMHFQ